MTANWQDAIALTAVAVAALYLLHRCRQFLAGRKGTGCGTCGSCPAGEPQEQELVTLEPLDSGTIDRCVMQEPTTGALSQRTTR